MRQILFRPMTAREFLAGLADFLTMAATAAIFVLLMVVSSW